MSTADLDPKLMRAPWRGPRTDTAGRVQIMRDPAAADESVLAFPVRWMSDTPPQVKLNDPPVVLDQLLTDEPGWQPVPLPPLPAGATGHVLLTRIGWRPSHGTPYSGSLPRTQLAPALLSTFQAGRPSPSAWALSPKTAPQLRYTTGALQVLTNALFADHPQVLSAAYLPATSTAVAAARSVAGATVSQPALRFAFACCQYPAGLLDARPAQASFQRLAQRCDATADALQHVLLIGDQIYADATYGLLDATRTDDRFNTAHAAWLGMKPLRHIMATVPVHCMLDDHEIEDNWEPPGPQTLEDGLLSFIAHQRPDIVAAGAQGPKWSVVPLGAGHEVFMLDTRTERDPRPWAPGSQPIHLIGPAQREALSRWLETTRSPVRWIASPVWLLPRPVGRPADDGTTRPLEPALCDAWPGYPASLDWLLGLIAHEHIQNIVMLCGDAHLAGHTVLTLSMDNKTSTPTRVDLLHCPALYAPFPFANARPHQYLTSDTLAGATTAGAWHCSVQSTLWENGDGFVELVVQASSPHITAIFNTATAPITVRIP
ncbi:alkaline phosphatase D family protein [Hydrogenophaga sp.]|uniref:alkaline phosphatase D family protein n=1 Tax=Hydrogenophaga sp. TaxID=1904254 RepID=UPI00286E24E3|nr:alkaline phosphatase D family protein [Hydrogenophaga sp.]